LFRPIGYPAFLALLGTNPTAALYVQALLLSIIPICTFLLIRLLTENNILGFAGGLVSTISPTGIAIGSFVLSDALFASLFAVVFTAMVYGTLHQSLRWIFVSAIISGFAILVRPILLFWPVVAVTISTLIATFQNGSQTGLGCWLKTDKSRCTQMLVLFLVPTIFIILMSGANYAKNGIFTVSIIGNRALREYLAIRSEEWGIAGHLPLSDAVRRNRNVVRKRYETMTPEERAHAFLPESIAIFKKYPLQTIKAFFEDAQENSVGANHYFWSQLPFMQHEQFFSRVSALEARLRSIAVIMTLLGPFISVFAIRVNPSQDVRRLVPMIFAMSITFLYFLILSGITFWQGPRIMYPTEILEITTAATLVALLVRVVRPLTRTDAKRLSP
jgi:hypothetical protein